MGKSIRACLKAATAMADEDAAAVITSLDAYIKAGMPLAQAQTAAVNDLIATVTAERTELVGLLRAQHAPLFATRRAELAPSPVSAAQPPRKPPPAPQDTAAAVQPEPADEFIRPATKQETHSNASKRKAMREIPDKPGHETVFKPAGEQGAGFYYRPTEAAKAPAVEAPAAPAEAPTLATRRATNKRAAAAKARREFNPETDSLLQALAKMGGIRRDVMAREFGLKPEELKHTVNVGGLKGFPFRATNGMDMDGALTALTEAGYFAGVPEDQVRTQFEAAVYNELGGGRELTPAGNMKRAADLAEGDRQAQIEREAADDFDPFEPGASISALDEFSADDLEESGYADASPEAKALTQQLLAEAEAMGIDTEGLREESARGIDEQTEDFYHARLQAAARQAIAQAGQDAASRDAKPTQRGPARDGAPAGDQGQEGLTLEAQTSADLKAKTEREAAALASEKAQKAAEQERLRKAAADRDTKARADQTVDDFQLGQSADAQLSGMGDMFAATPTQAPAAPAAPAETKPPAAEAEQPMSLDAAQEPDRKVRLADLPRDMREELFNEHATNLNPGATEAKFYAKSVPSGLLRLKGVAVDAIPADQLKGFDGAKLTDIPPIVIADGRLIDGQHRIQWARANGYTSLRYIDVTGLIDTNAGGFISELPRGAGTQTLDRDSGFPDTEIMPRPEVDEVPAADPEDQRILDQAAKNYRTKQAEAFGTLQLTALPELTRPRDDAPQATKERYAAVELAQKVFGKRIIFYRANIPFANGFQASWAPGHIFIAESTKRPVMAVLGHEMLHGLRNDNPALFNKLSDRLRAVLDNPGAYHEALARKYASSKINSLNFDRTREELIADIVGDFFTDRAFWQQVASGQPTLFGKILKAVRDFLNGVLAKLQSARPYGTERYLSDVKAARDIVAEIMGDYAAAAQAGQRTGPVYAEAEAMSAREDQTDTPAFRAWFGASKVVDADGKPLVVYHATPNDFTEFKPGGDDATKSGQAIWFGTDAENPPAAHNVLKRRKVGDFKEGVRTIPAYLKISRPLVLDNGTKTWARSVWGDNFPQIIGRDTLADIRKDYDGVLYYGSDGKLSEAVVFEPEQIKSAIGNRGTFDPNDASIVRASGQEYTAPDGTNPAAGTANPAAVAPVRRAGDAVPRNPRIRALGIAARIETAGSQALVGQRVESAADLAELAQVYRDPRYETFRTFFIKNGEVVHATGVSSRLPSSTPMVPTGMTQAEYVDLYRQTMKTLGADGYYVLHNHPSGDPTPSDADTNMTDLLGKLVPGMLGHVVINSNKYATFGPNEAPRIVHRDFGADNLLEASLPSPILGRAISKPQQLADLGKSLQRDGWLTIVGTDSNGRVRVIADAPQSVLTRTPTALVAMTRRLMRQSGAANIFVVGSDADVNSRAVTQGISGGFITDAVGDAGRSMREQGLAGPAGRGVKDTRGGWVLREDNAADQPMSFGDNDPRGPTLTRRIANSINDRIQTPETFNLWHKTIGTQFHKSKISPLFRRVFEAGQDYIHDTAAFATRAADLAPTLLPNLERRFGDFWKRMALRKVDTDALASAVFEGTLENRIWTPQELKQRGMNDRQQGLYRQFREATNKSLDMLVAAEVARTMGAEANDLKHLIQTDDLAAFSQQARKRVVEKMDAADQALADVKKAHKAEKAAMDKAQAAEAKIPANTRPPAESLMLDRHKDTQNGLNLRQGQERAQAERELAKWEQMEFDIADKYEKIENLKANGYAPLMRFGRYTVTVIGQDETGKPVTEFFGMYESKAEMNAAAREARAYYPEATSVDTGTIDPGAWRAFKGVSPETLAIFGEAAGIDKDSEAFQQYLKLATANQSALKRLIHRKGTPGFSKDPTRVLAAFITSNARRSSQMMHFGELSEAAEAARQSKAGDIAAEARKLAEALQESPEDGETVAAIKALGFTVFLGGSVASAAVNLTQTATTTLPFLSAHSNPAKASAAIAKAMALARPGGMDPRSELGKALHRADEEGITQPQEMHNLQAEATRNLVSMLPAPLRTTTRRLGYIWGSMFSFAEQVNRRIAFIAAFNLASKMSQAELNAAAEKGKHDATPFAFAANAVDETQFVYNRGGQSNWARNPVGSLMLMFKTYTVSYLELFKRMPMREKALMVLMLWFFSGLNGLFGADDLDDLIDTVGQRLGFDTNAKEWKHKMLVEHIGPQLAAWMGMDEIAGKQIGRFAESGVGGLVGSPIDITRLGMGNLIPGTGLLRKDVQNPENEVLEMFGPMGSYATKILEAARGEPGKVFPVAIANAIKAADMAKTGVYRDVRNKTVIETTPADAWVKAIGFQPGVVAQDQRANRIQAQRNALQRATEQEIAADITNARFLDDQEAEDKAWERLDKWNERNPDTEVEITEKQLRQRLKQMDMTRAERLEKSTPKELRK